MVTIILVFSTTIFYSATTDPVFVDPYRPITPNWPSVTDHDRRLNEVINSIPADASVLTQNNIAPHLTNRQDIYIRLTDGSIKPQYVLIDKSHFSYNEPNIRPPPAQVLPGLLASGEYALTIKCGPIELYERLPSGTSVTTVGCGS